MNVLTVVSFRMYEKSLFIICRSLLIKETYIDKNNPLTLVSFRMYESLFSFICRSLFKKETSTDKNNALTPVSFRMYEGLFSLLFLMHRSLLICLQPVCVHAPVCVSAYV